MRLGFHGFFGGHTSGVEHGLESKLVAEAFDDSHLIVADLSTGEVMAGSERGRVFVQRRLSVSCSIICEVRKGEEAWLLWFPLLFKIARVHCV